MWEERHFVKRELSVVCFGRNCTELQFSHAYKIAYAELEAKSRELLQSRKLLFREKKKKGKKFGKSLLLTKPVAFLHKINHLQKVFFLNAQTHIHLEWNKITAAMQLCVCSLSCHSLTKLLQELPACYLDIKYIITVKANFIMKMPKT